MFIKNKTTTKIILLFLVFTLFLTVVEAQTPLRIYKFENLGECVHIAGPESGSSERLIFVIVGEELTNERSKADALVT